MAELPVDKEVLIFLDRIGKLHHRIVAFAERLDDLVDDDFRRRCAGRQADRRDVPDRVPVDFRRALAQNRCLCAGS